VVANARWLVGLLALVQDTPRADTREPFRDLLVERPPRCCAQRVVPHLLYSVVAPSLRGCMGRPARADLLAALAGLRVDVLRVEDPRLPRRIGVVAPFVAALAVLALARVA